MNKAEKQIAVISMKKLLGNIIRYWWILGISICIGVLSCVYIIKSTENSEGLSPTNISLMLKMDYIGEKSTEAQGIYYENILETYMVSEVKEILSRDNVIREINNALVANQYEAFDELLDIPTVEQEIGQTKIVKLNLSGKNIERTRFVLNTYLDLLNEELRTSNVQLFLVNKEDEVMDKYVLSNSDVVKGILAFVLACIIGTVMICILTLYDSRIWCEKELELLLRGTLLGSISKKGVCNIKWGKIKYILERAEAKSVGIQIVSNKRVSELLAFAKEQMTGVEFVVITKGEVEEFLKMKEVDVIIANVQFGEDLLNEWNDVLESYEIAEKPIIGYVGTY